MACRSACSIVLCDVACRSAFSTVLCVMWPVGVREALFCVLQCVVCCSVLPSLGTVLLYATELALLFLLTAFLLAAGTRHIQLHGC